MQKEERLGYHQLAPINKEICQEIHNHVQWDKGFTIRKMYQLMSAICAWFYKKAEISKNDLFTENMSTEPFDESDTEQLLIFYSFATRAKQEEHYMYYNSFIDNLFNERDHLYKPISIANEMNSVI